MGENMKCEQAGLIDELVQGKELAKQLCDHLFSSPSSPSSSSSSSHKTNEVLIEKILSTYEKALAMLNWKANVGVSKANNGSKMDSLCSFTNGSPGSEVPVPEVKHKDISKKRKTMPTEQVKVCLGTTNDGSLDDGYSWRKYGQKDILGAKFPRGYYRCTYRNVQGCLATKQVQKSDEDPMICEITYKGRHTCTQASYLNKVVAPPSKAKMGLGENKPHPTHQKNQPQQEEKIEQPPETIFSFGSPDLEVKIEDMIMDHQDDIFPSIGSENEDNMFPYLMIGDNLMESFSPAFISPTTSESNIFCLSPCHWGSTGLGPSVQSSESDFTDIVSAPTSVTNSPITDFDFLLDKINFDTDFPMNTTELCT